MVSFITCLRAALAGCPHITIAWVPSWTQVNATSNPGVSEYGMEDGVVVRREDGSFTMLAAEMWTQPYAVAMQLGMYKSANAIDWTRQRTIRRSLGTKDGSTLHAAHWGPLLTKDGESWMVSYVGYRAPASNASGFLSNFQGTIFSRYATESGDQGLDGDFGEAASGSTPAFEGDKILLAPDDFNVNGPWPYQCQGLQGTDSFAPYQLPDGTWAALAGTSQQQQPYPPGPRWAVSVATAPKLSGPWTRYNPANRSNPANAPCSKIARGIENPVISRRPDDANAFHTVYDGGAGLQGAGFGYACSEDGLEWSPGVGVGYPFGTSARTPFGLVPLSQAEVAARAEEIVAYGVLNRTQLHAPNSSLSWLFLTGHSANETWEHFQTSIVYLSW